MNFVYPSFLYALSAVAIPIIIHLYNFRKHQTIYFSNVAFLKDLKQETQAKSKLKHLLILASRILAIVFLVLAFAQPVIPSENKIPVGDATISVFIDNSFSMDAINKNGTLLDEAKKKALEIANHYKASDHFQILTNDFEGRHQNLVSKAEFIKRIDEIKISSSTKMISEILLRQTEAMNVSISGINRKNKMAYIISDFQKTIVNMEHIKKDSLLTVYFVPTTATERNNIFIDTCWFESPVRQLNQIEKLHVRIKNRSEKTLENNPVKLFINDIQKTPASFTIEKESETEVVFSFVIKNEHLKNADGSSKNTYLEHCKVQLNDYPVTFDDTFYFTYEATTNIPILCINSDNNSLNNASLNKFFNTDSAFVFKNVAENKLDYSNFSTYQLIILNELKTIPSGLSQELKRFIDKGGSVLVFPNAQIDNISYKDFMLANNADYFLELDSTKTKVATINNEHIVYKDVFDKKTFSATNLDLPIVYKHYPLSKTTRSNSDYLLKLQNGDVFLNVNNIGKGKLYTCAVPLNINFSNFTKHALFVPTIYKIALYSQVNYPLFYTIGSNPTIEFTGAMSTENTFHLKSTKNSFDIIPEQKTVNSIIQLLEHNQIKNAGNYNLLSNNQLITGFSFNFNRKESDLKCYTNDEMSELLTRNDLNNIHVIKNQTKGLIETLSELNSGTKLWKICIILALLFLAAEVLLLRFMKEQKTV